MIKEYSKMNDCVSGNSLFLSENYVVQSVENMPVSIIDCDKIGVTQFIHSGQLANGMPVIQFAESNSNSKNKVLHPLEAEIQRDLELKCRQETVGKNEPLSVIQSGPTMGPNKSFKVLDTSSSIYSGLPLVQNLGDGRGTVLSESENFFPLNRQLMLEKREYFIMPDNSVLVNVNVKESKSELEENSNKSNDCENGDASRYCEDNDNNCNTKMEQTKYDGADINLNLNKLDKNKIKLESDSENEENEVEPVCDYEPDPECSLLAVHESNEKEKPNKCYMCFKTFRQKKNMYAHIRKIHSTQPKIEGGILCPLCKMHALRQEHLRAHLETLHEIPIEREDKLFSTLDEFLSWKKSMERETLSFYVSKSSSKLLANNQQKTYYKCHRSGTYMTLKKENRKKKLKAQGSNKIGATCPAAIEVTENTSGINVVFWKTHVGHVNDLTHLALTKEEKANIMKYMGSGCPWDKVLDIFKNESIKSSPKELPTESEPNSAVLRPKTILRRKPVKDKILKRVTQSLVIEKADALLNLLETTEIKAEFRPKVCLMIENLISTVKRRAVKNLKKENTNQKKYLFRKFETLTQKN